MKIVLLRHGETLYNRERRYQGTRDIPLSETGRAALSPAPFAARRVWVSPLCRAVETARILFPGAQLIRVPDLREIELGAFEGRTADEMQDDAAYRAWVDGNCQGRPPGGETREEYSARTCAAFEGIVNGALARGEEVLPVVAHGGTQMAVMKRFSDMAEDYFSWGTGNGAGYVLDTSRWEAGKLTLVEKVCFARKEMK